MKRLVVVLGMMLASAAHAFAQAPLATAPGTGAPAPRAEVLVLGVYHMANPGRDIFDMKADDVLAIFGAGHLGWLRQNVANDPTLRLRKLAEFVR